MAALELLNNVDHKDLKVCTEKKAEFGDNVGGALIFPSEFVAAHKEYPIYFQKDRESGEFQAIALFGFNNEENLYLKNGYWDARYIPALIQREPFLIGFQQDNDESKMVIHVDMQSPRISSDDSGNKVFLDNGGSSKYLETIKDKLIQVHEGLAASKLMFDTFLEWDLIEPFTLDIVFDDGSALKTTQYYTIHQEKLYELDDKSIATLHKGGYLQLAYMVLQSMSNVHHLMKRKNASFHASGQ